MSTVTQKTTRVSEAQNNFIDQFKNHPNIDAISEAFGTQIQELEDAAFEVLLNTILSSSTGVQLDGLGDIVGEERQGKNDDDYRIAIGARILINSSSGTVPELNEIFTALAGVSVLATVVQPYPAAIDYTVSASALPISADQIGSALIDAKAGGVALSFTWFEEAPAFLFDVAGQGFDLGKLGGLITG